MVTAKKKNNIKKWLFYFCITAVPVLQFIIMYVVVNINSFVMAFRSYNSVTDKWSFVAFENFKFLFTEIRSLDSVFSYAIKNSLIAWFYKSVIGILGGLIFSYYIFKRNLGWNVYRIMLFLPSVISSTVLIIIFRYYGDRFLPEIINKMFGTHLYGFLTKEETIFPSILAFNLFIGFGASVLMFTSAMTSVSDSVLEAAEVDGVNSLQEFFIIVLPQIVPTVSIFVVSSIANMFTDQLNLYSFYYNGARPQVYTVGYYLYMKLQTAKGFAEYPMLAALGLIITAVVVPVVILVRWLMNKIDPMKD